MRLHNLLKDDMPLVGGGDDPVLGPSFLLAAVVIGPHKLQDVFTAALQQHLRCHPATRLMIGSHAGNVRPQDPVEAYDRQIQGPVLRYV